MSTRSCVEVYESDRYIPTARLVALYRHHDGYLAGAGATLVEALKASTTPTEVAAYLLAQKYDATSYSPARGVYELTTAAEDHGDLEHVYTVWHTATGWDVKHAVRRSWNDDKFPSQTYELSTFCKIVEAEVRHMEARAKARADADAKELAKATTLARADGDA